MRMMDELGASSSNSSTFSSSSSALAAADSSPPSFSYFSILYNYPLMSAILGFAVAQSLKLVTTWYREKRWDLLQLIASGGMPSSHSSTVTALVIAIGCQEGFDGSIFAIAAILACVVMYDAVGVRLHAGKQAELLNQIVYELPAEHPLADTRPLRELLGHTPFQVLAGSFLGIFIALMGYAVKSIMGSI